MRIITAFITLLLCYGSTSAATPVVTRPISELLIFPHFSAPATVHSLNHSRLSAELMARIKSIKVRVGDRVKSGDLLVELDCRTFHSQLKSQLSLMQELTSLLQLSKSQLARARSLKKQRNISDEQVEQRETDLAVLRAKHSFQQQRITEFRIQTERCEIKAPFDGVVRERIAHQGELAEPGTALLRLQQLSELEVSAKLTPDQRVADVPEFYFSYQQQRFPLQLRHLLPIVDSRTRTLEARLQFTSKPAPAGAAGRLVWRSVSGLLPADQLIQRIHNREPVLGVMYNDHGTARFHPLANAIEGQASIIDLPGDTELIIEGGLQLKDGDPVNGSSPELIKSGAKTAESEE